ncbi:vacuolar protein sorting 2B [Guillardia theta CCMP2712]|uniref:Vacuolar protein sorting 2B n=1 Tax=Guillardia theta (strain CCMP2712) TaxID=905079 RepID=L1J7C3_GUITC|nr:vacuolar protein sorting 2B [Guillardia theta CCMP2712]EKX44438.1 vacuolar protein sorting 2B [Guillardia theta CCMP2712]|eukprot:XP_005831418.1 vacuolar protein sorting 2B [Guillardia theta CCMP2712]
MSFLFGGKKKTPQELMREYKRNVDKSVREIEREKTKLQTQEKKIINDIRKAAKEGQMGPVRVMAKDLVRTRAQITKFYQMKCQMQAVGLRLQTIKSTQAMTEAMKGAAKAMKGMNAKVNPIAMQRILFEFEKQSEIMDSKQEMMDDAIDDAFEADDEEAQVDEVIGQVLSEIGIDLGDQMHHAAPSSSEESQELRRRS